MSTLHIEVVYATQQRQTVIPLTVAEGTTVEAAIQQSGILAKYPELDASPLKTGIYSKACKLDTVLRDKDRVEIYRPLIADPKEIRKQRAAEGKVMKKGGGDAE